MMSSSIVNILVISAPSGAGKTTLIEQIAQKHRFRYSISHTTRAPREHEKHGKNYHFVSFEQFDQLRQAGAFLETTYIHGHHYGTAWKNFASFDRPDEWLLLDLDVHGLITLREKIRDIVSVFILPPSIDTLRERILIRQPAISTEELDLRLSTARKEMEYVFEYDYSIFNTDLQKATSELSMILQTEQLKNKRNKLFLESLLY